MFFGQYAHNLDEKKRMTIPAKFRNDLGGHFFMTVGFDGCITIYTADGFLKYSEKLDSLDSNKKDARQLKRFIAANAIECECDSHGRIVLPDNLLARASIKKEVMLVGSFDHIEVWSKEKWNEYENDASSNFEDVAEKLAN